jgi:hypothetical protein
MKEGYFQNIPPEEIAPPVEKIPPQEITAPLSEAADLASLENNSEERPEKSVVLMAAAESGMNRNEEEVSREKMEVMETARQERLAILNSVFARVKGTIEKAKEKMVPVMAPVKEKIDEHVPKPAQEIMSQLMDVSSIKMYTEASRGKTLTGKELSPKDRVLSALIAGTNDIAKLLFFQAARSGNTEYAKLGSIAYGASWALLLVKNGPKIMQNLKELASYYGFGEASPVLARAEATFSQYGYSHLEEQLAY